MTKVLVVITLLLCCATGFSQQTAQTTPAQEVKAGDVVTFTVTLDKEPTFDDPAIQVIAGPRDVSAPGVQNIALAKDSKTVYKVALRIPATAEPGTWEVKQVRLLVPAGRTVALKNDRMAFQVTKPESLDLPTQASVAPAQ